MAIKSREKESYQYFLKNPLAKLGGVYCLAKTMVFN